MRLRQILPVSIVVLGLAACGAPPPPAAPPPPPSAPAAPSADPARAAAPATDRDPAIAALAEAVLKTCKLDEEGGEDGECPAVKAWDEADDPFADGKGDATLFSMLKDSNPRVRHLASRRAPIMRAFWSDKAHAVELAAMAKANQDRQLDTTFGNLVTDVDWQTLGLADTLKDLAVNTPRETRAAIGYHLFEAFPTPAAAEAAKLLVADKESSIADHTTEELWRGDAQPQVCELIVKLMTGSDFLQSTALMSASRAKSCPGMTEKVIAELGKRLAEPGKVDRQNNRGYDYVRATRHLCLHHDEATAKKEGLALLKRFMAPAIADPRTRADAMRFYAECDEKGARAAIAPYAADKAVGATAKEILAGLKGAAKKH